jgi:hypothetical protein
MGLTVGDIESRARELYGDTSTTSPGVSQALIISRINDWYHRLTGIFQRRPFSVAHGTTTTNWSAATLAQSAKSIDTTQADLLEILALHLETNNTNIGVGAVLRRVSPHRILMLQRTLSTEASPTLCSIERIATTTVANQGKWRVRVHPIPDTAYYLSRFELRDPQTLTTSGQAPDVTEEEAYIVARLVAADAAMMIERPRSVADQILTGIPDRVMRALGRGQEIVARKRRAEVQSVTEEVI